MTMSLTLGRIQDPVDMLPHVARTKVGARLVKIRRARESSPSVSMNRDNSARAASDNGVLSTNNVFQTRSARSALFIFQKEA